MFILDGSTYQIWPTDHQLIVTTTYHKKSTAIVLSCRISLRYKKYYCNEVSFIFKCSLCWWNFFSCLLIIMIKQRAADVCPPSPNLTTNDFTNPRGQRYKDDGRFWWSDSSGGSLFRAAAVVTTARSDDGRTDGRSTTPFTLSQTKQIHQMSGSSGSRLPGSVMTAARLPRV